MGKCDSKMNNQSMDATLRHQKWNPMYSHLQSRTEILQHQTIVSLKNRWVPEEL